METVMTDTQSAPAIEPITASADGKRNAWCLACPATNVKMSYAACLHRAAVIDDPDYRSAHHVGRVPKDWNDCDRPAGRDERSCIARSMRAEEKAAGKAIFFVARSVVASLPASATKWVMERVKRATTPSAAARVKKDIFDGMGDSGSMADAVNAMVAAGAALPKTITVTKPEKAPPRVLTGVTEGIHPVALASLPKAMPGESPLQMARRLAAEKKGATA